MTSERIELQREKNRRGAIISMEIYRELSIKIMEAISEKAGKSISLPELIETVQLNYPSAVLPWHILQVKIDLHQRGIVKVSFDRYRTQIIEINEKTRKNLTRLVRNGETQWWYLVELVQQQSSQLK